LLRTRQLIGSAVTGVTEEFNGLATSLSDWVAAAGLAMAWTRE